MTATLLEFTEGVRKYAAEQAVREEEALAKGIEEPSAENRSKTVVEKGAGGANG